MMRFPAARTRVGTGVALLAATALLGAPAAAHAAAEDLPDLTVSFDREPVAEVDNGGTTVGVYLYNNGGVTATAVTLTLDLSKLSDAVEATVPEWSEQCELAERKITCGIGQLESAQTGEIVPLALVSKAGAPVGDAGEIAVTIDGAEDDANPADDTTTFPVTVVASGADLIVAAADLNTDKDPVGPGDEVPFYSVVANEGDTTATDATITLSLPTAATFAEQYSDCTYQDYYPNDKGGEYVYGPSEVTCPLPELEPGDLLPLFDEETGESLFNVTFGRNLPGPEELSGYFQAALAGELRAAKGAKPVAGKGPSFADAVKKLPAGAAAQLKKKSLAREIDEEDNYVSFRLWTKKNTIDVQVTAKPISGAVGDVVDLPYEVVNQGPSDGGGPSVLITAPTGTVLLPPSDWCWTDGTDHELRPESAKLRCSFESEFPTVHSGYGKVAHSVKLKIKSTPGTDGTIHGASVAVASTESNPADNTAKIVFTTGAGGGNGAGGGDNGGGTGGEGGSDGPGLPITGAPVGLLAAVGGAILVGGVLLMVATRRRQAEVPRD